jgi:sugar phosphate isomerase/epimerase
MTPNALSRRSFLTMSALLPWALRTPGAPQIPVGLELYSVRNALKQDPTGTVRAVAALGYQCVEFYAPYFEWTESQTKDMRKLLDDLGIRCYSTHNDISYMAMDKISRVRELNLILGCKYVVLASAHEEPGPEGWKKVAGMLNTMDELFGPSGLKAGYHNHQTEFTQVDGVRPIEIIAKGTRPSVMLQLDVGTCIEAGSDPVAWIRSNPGRIRSLHLKEWSREPGKGYSVLFGEGVADWKAIFAAAESVGGAEYYLIEQEGSRFSELETAKKCLDAFHSAHPA